MDEWEIDLKKPLADMFLWNLKTLFQIEKKQDFSYCLYSEKMKNSNWVRKVPKISWKKGPK
jgi:hypothetical protein